MNKLYNGLSIMDILLFRGTFFTLHFSLYINSEKISIQDVIIVHTGLNETLSSVVLHVDAVSA